MADLRRFRIPLRVRAGQMKAQEPDSTSRRQIILDRALEAEKLEGDVDEIATLSVETLLHTGTTAGFYGHAAGPQPGPFTQTYATADPTLSAYTADVENVAYTGLASGLGGTPYASITDLEALRVAVENVRGFAEDVAQLLNSLIDALQANGSAR